MSTPESELKNLRRLLRENPESVLKALFEEEFCWPPSLDIHTTYMRFEDDSPQGSVSIQFTPDGDSWIMILGGNPDPNDFKMSFRFRTYGGGGQSLRVRKALLALALAIKWDNEDHPQDRISS
jgi:hypothetical protein